MANWRGPARLLLQERELQNVKNIHASLDFGLSECLERGDMGVFERLIKLQKDVPGFIEFSLYNQKGRVTDSSDNTQRGRTLDPQLQSQLFAKPERTVRTTGDRIEIFKPEIATAKCMECHEDFKAGTVCGVSYFRFSNDASTRLAGQFSTLSAASNRRWGWLSLAILVVGGLMVIGLTFAITNPIIKALTGVANNLNSHSAGVYSAAEQVAGASESLAGGASKQAASLEETSASLTEMASMSAHNAENVTKASELARQARSMADNGLQETHVMAGAMQELQSSSNEVAKIIKTIDAIAFQTNILALNAAVEAARAGEAGMGFAVVADEVRNLAQRCTEAAKETTGKIEIAISKTAQGVTVSSRVAEGLNEIVEKVRRVDGLIAELAAASQQQSDGMAQINTAVSEMDQVTQSNAATAEESASAAQELNAQALALKETVAKLAALIDSSAGQAESTTEASPARVPACPQAQREKPRRHTPVRAVPLFRQPVTRRTAEDAAPLKESKQF